ncbi:MAG: PDZ domain-containing protein [Saprospiraceae bacterium]|nr:PDZ domain-containing protein [Saprospiraceae bacterium]
MKKILLSILLPALCAVLLVAQENPENKSTTKVIVKKITIENENGVETTSESTDTFDLSQLKQMDLEGFEWNDKDFKELDIESLKNGKKKMRIFMHHDGDSTMHKKELNVFDFEPDHMAVWNDSQKAASPNKAVLGVQLENVDGSNGAQVIEIFEGSAAEKIGLQIGDIIISVAGKETKNVESVIEVLSQKSPGEKVKLKYLRSTKEKSATAVLQERKEEVISKVMCPTTKQSKVVCCKPGNDKKCKEDKLTIFKDGEGIKKIRIIKDKDGASNENKVIIIKKDGAGNEVIKEIEDIDKGGKAELEIIRESEEGRSLNVEVLTGSPNPNNGQMKISFEGKKEPTTIEVLDLNGKEIYKEKIESFDGTYNKEIEIENAKGTLILKVTQGEKVLTQKIIVK